MSRNPSTCWTSAAATSRWICWKKNYRQLLGVDLASVKLSDVAKQKLNVNNTLKAQLKPKTDAEQLPFESGGLDLTVSVFGIEYSDLKKSLPEAIRVLKPGGAFHALMHADESVISSMSARALSEFRDDDMASIVANLTL